MKLLLPVVSTTLCLTLATPLSAATIGFEKNAAGFTPSDNEEIALSDVFTIDGVSVRFGFDVDSNGDLDTPAVFERAANQDAGGDTGFWGLDQVRDVAAPGYENQLGDFFLRQSGGEPYPAFGTFSIFYEAQRAITAASGEIWDIDGKPGKTEQYSVKAYGGSQLLQEVISPLGDNSDYNGKPWEFGFSGLSDIERIDITFIGSKQQGIGLAFNNFFPTQDNSKTPVSTAPTGALFALGLVGLLRSRRSSSRLGASSPAGATR